MPDLVIWVLFRTEAAFFFTSDGPNVATFLHCQLSRIYPRPSCECYLFESVLFASDQSNLIIRRQKFDDLCYQQRSLNGIKILVNSPRRWPVQTRDDHLQQGPKRRLRTPQRPQWQGRPPTIQWFHKIQLELSRGSWSHIL